MTSKEALEQIIVAFEGIDAAEGFDYGITNQEYYDTIKKDLSVLEIIKKYYNIEVTYTGLKISYKKDAPMSYSGFAEEERKTIEDWLNNEK